jgi:hypothetical protein
MIAGEKGQPGRQMRNRCRVAVTIALLALSGAVYLAAHDRATAQPQAEQPLKNPTKAVIEAPREATVTVFDNREVQGVLGKEVRSAVDESMGRIVNVIVDRTGEVRAAVIEFGGFLGVGSRKIAIAWKALHFLPDVKKGEATLELTRDQVRDAPEFREDKPVVVLGAAGRLESLPFP